MNTTQQAYYARTAAKYETMRSHEWGYQHFALSVMLGMADFIGVQSILEIGSGTGRAIEFMKRVRPDILIKGIEPVGELREIAYARGLSDQDITEGEATALRFATGEFDLVCEFAVLHHIRRPELAVSEMLRVAGKAVFMSDSNNFGQGSAFLRATKQLINALGLWRLADYIKTRGKGFTISEGDGLAYSYSVFNNYEQIRAMCKSVHLFNISPSRPNLYRTAEGVALLGIKHGPSISLDTGTCVSDSL